MQLSSHSLCECVPLRCAIFANFMSRRYTAQRPTRTDNPVSDWDKRLLCPYNNSLSTDVSTKHTSYKKLFTHCYRPQRVKYFRLCMLHFGASLSPSFFSATCKNGLLNYCMRKRNSIPEQIFLYIRGGKSTPGVMSRPNNSFKISGPFFKDFILREDYLLVVSRFRKKKLDNGPFTLHLKFNHLHSDLFLEQRRLLSLLNSWASCNIYVFTK